MCARMILAGTGPAGGEGIEQVNRITYLDIARGLLTRQDPKQFLFFTRTPNGRRAGKEFLARLEERTDDRDKAISVRVPRPAQGHPPMGQADARGRREHPPAGARHHRRQRQNGAHPEHVELHRRLPNSQLVIYPDAGRGGVLKFHEVFVERALEFL